MVENTPNPVPVRILLVTDGALSFAGDGLGGLVCVLQGAGSDLVRFELTLGHLRSDVTSAEVVAGLPGVARRIRGFAFDDPRHFGADMYDEVWLFGSESAYGGPSYAARADRSLYPTGSLGEAELLNIAAHMHRGGGLFAAGDAGDSGRAMCSAVNRVRSMRSWDAAGRRLPAAVDVRLYGTSVGVSHRALHPHPLLCDGVELSDVPAGECREPMRLTEPYLDGSPEFPPALDGSGTVAPEVVAWSSGEDGAGTIAAYDGHRAGVGRVVCDATWRRFLGATRPEVAGYVANIGLWIAPPVRQRGIRRRLWWELALLADADAAVDPADAAVADLCAVGERARALLEERTSACRAVEWTFPLVEAVWPEVRRWFDPWAPQRRLREEGEPLLPWIDVEPMVDVALGGAVLAVRRTSEGRDVEEVAAEGARLAFRGAVREMTRDLENLGHLLAAAGVG